MATSASTCIAPRASPPPATAARCPPESTHALVRRDLPDGVTVRDLGPHRLKDLTVPERIFQLVVGGLADDFPALRTLDSSRTNLPAQLTSFVGRERELGELQELARAHRLVTVIGTGGTGKTRLMLQASAELVVEQADGVWLVELAPITDPELIVQAVARGLGIREEPGRPLIETVGDFLRTKSLLILLDNCEHLLVCACAALANALLGQCPGVCASWPRALLKLVGPLAEKTDLARAFAGPASPARRFRRAHSRTGPAGAVSHRLRGRAAVRGAGPAAEASFEMTPGTPRQSWRFAGGWTASRWPSSWRRRGCGHAVSRSRAPARPLPPPHRREPHRPPRQQTLRASLDWSFACSPRPNGR